MIGSPHFASPCFLDEEDKERTKEYVKRILLLSTLNIADSGEFSDDSVVTINNPAFTCNYCNKPIEYTWNVRENTFQGEVPGARLCDGNFSEIEFEINVPTGELVICSDEYGFRELFGEALCLTPSINYQAGIRKMVEFHVDKNVFMLFTDQHDGEVLKLGDTITVEKPNYIEGSYNEATDTWIDDVLEYGDPNSIEIGSFGSSLGYIVDKAVLEKLFEESGVNSADKDGRYSTYKNRIASERVRPGVYKCTFYGNVTHNYSGQVTYAKMVWDREE